jgi:hypothetical protein
MSEFTGKTPCDNVKAMIENAMLFVDNLRAFRELEGNGVYHEIVCKILDDIIILSKMIKKIEKI